MNPPAADRDAHSPVAEDPHILELLDRYTEAISRRDIAARDQILAEHPELRSYVGCLELLDRMAVSPGSAAQSPGDQGNMETLFQEGRSSAATSPNRTDETFPRPFGRYELLDELGRGGMGVVYRARQADLNRVVALKMIRSQQLASPDELRRFQVEARAAARLRHANIITIHDIGQVGNQHFYTMDYVPGTSLASLTSRGPLNPQMAAGCLALVARAVHYLHTQGILHRDLKPHNILLDPQGCPYVTDFGLAKVTEQDSSQTQSGTILGTPSYMSPEQAGGRQREIAPCSDVWSLGAILYETLTGRPPFKEATYIDTLLQVMEGEPTLPAALNRRVPGELQWICMKCLTKDPAARYATAAELAEDLERFTRGEVTSARPGGLFGKVQRWARREPALAMRLALLFAAMLIVQLRQWLGSAPLDNYPGLMAVFGSWGAASLGLQQMLHRPRTAELARYLWSLADLELFTILLFIAHAPRGSLLVGYPFFIAASGLLFRVRLVAMTTVASVLSYLMLLAFQPEEVPPPHYIAVFVITLACLGGVVAIQVHRVRSLSRFYDRTGGT